MQTKTDLFKAAQLEFEASKNAHGIIFDREHYWFWHDLLAKTAAEIIAESL